MGELIGYAQVSTPNQNLDTQLDALRAPGCSRIFAEIASGALRDRPELAAAFDYLRAGDTLVVVRLDRRGRTLGKLLDTAEDLQRQAIGFRPLGDPIDITSATGLHAAEARRYERTRAIADARAYDAGRAAAKARGDTGGRPLSVTPEKVEAARASLAAGYTTTAAARAVGVGKRRYTGISPLQRRDVSAIMAGRCPCGHDDDGSAPTSCGHTPRVDGCGRSA